MTKDLLVAQRYARALFEIARALGRDEDIEAELESMSAALKAAPDTEKFFLNPSLTLAQKKAFLEKVYRDRSQEVYGHLLNFFLLLFKKNRFYLIHDVAAEFKRIADEAQGQSVAEIRSAVPLSPASQKAIVRRLESIARCAITASNVVDPELIGGVSVHMRNRVFDDTVSNKLASFKKELTKAQSI